jgi:hypothetical protein
LRRPTRQQQEHRLRDILGELFRRAHVAQAAPTGRVNEARVPSHELGKGRLRPLATELLKQFPIIHGSTPVICGAHPEM